MCIVITWNRGLCSNFTLAVSRSLYKKCIVGGKNKLTSPPMCRNSRLIMPFVPMTYRDWWDEHDTPFRSSRLLDQHFGTGLRSHDLVKQTPTFPLHSSYYRPWRVPEKEHSTSTLKVDKDAYQIILDVQQFTPEEITVKTAENHIVVQGKHDEKRDEHGFVSRHFTRRYVLPEGHDPNDVVSTLSSDGVLTITAPKKEVFPANPERIVPIKQTGEPATEKPTETVMERNK